MKQKRSLPVGSERFFEFFGGYFMKKIAILTDTTSIIDAENKRKSEPIWFAFSCELNIS